MVSWPRLAVGPECASALSTSLKAAQTGAWATAAQASLDHERTQLRARLQEMLKLHKLSHQPVTVTSAVDHTISLLDMLLEAGGLLCAQQVLCVQQLVKLHYITQCTGQASWQVLRWRPWHHAADHPQNHP